MHKIDDENIDVNVRNNDDQWGRDNWGFSGAEE